MKVRLVLVVGAIGGLVVGVALRPGAPALPDDVHGDRELAGIARDLTDGEPAAVAVGVVGDGKREVATIGAPLDGEFEIGSVSKGLTGLLYVDAVERGAVKPGTRLGDILGLGDSDAADITLEELSQHRSGLPRLPVSATTIAKGWWATVAARNPYGESGADLLSQLRSVSVGDGDHEPNYSNLGFQALGLALATKAGTTYPELLEERLSEPLGITSMSVPTDSAGLTERAVQGRDSIGRKQQAWTGEAIGPAGGVRADIEDMTRVIAALLSGSAPGVAATKPVAAFDDDSRIGAAWFTTRKDGRTVTWHNGATGGFRSWLGFDRESGVGVVVLAATSETVDEIGFAMLAKVVRGLENAS